MTMEIGKKGEQSCLLSQIQTAGVERANYNALDVIKFLLAIFLVCAHTASERVSLPGALDMFCSLYVIIVPFFFVASSFLFFRKLELQDGAGRKKAWKRYTRRVLGMYLAWSVIYFCFIVAKWLLYGCSAGDVARYFHHAVVYSTYSTIWFLPALWVGVSLVYLCRYHLRCGIRSLLALAAFLYLVGALGYSFHTLTPFTERLHEAYSSVFVTWRNGLFNAFPFAVIGCLIAVRAGGARGGYCLIGTLAFGALFVAEAIGLKRFCPAADANFLLMLLPFSYFFVQLVLQIRMPDSCVYVPLRKMSMLIFVSQRIVLTAIPSVLGAGVITGFWDVTDNGILAMTSVVVEVCLLSFVLMEGAKKYKVLGYLM